MSTYSEKLKDPRWQKKRLEIMQRDDFACCVCGDKASTLHVHHIRYLNGYQPWDYKDFYLVTLCHKCHEAEEAEITKSNRPPGWKESVPSLAPSSPVPGQITQLIWLALNSEDAKLEMRGILPICQAYPGVKDDPAMTLLFVSAHPTSDSADVISRLEGDERLIFDQALRQQSNAPLDPSADQRNLIREAICWLGAYVLDAQRKDNLEKMKAPGLSSERIKELLMESKSINSQIRECKAHTEAVKKGRSDWQK